MKTFVKHMFQQCTRSSAVESNRKGLCLQEFTILLNFPVKSFVALIIRTDKFCRFQKKDVQKRQQNSGKSHKNLSQGIRTENREATKMIVWSLKYDTKQI